MHSHLKRNHLGCKVLLIAVTCLTLSMPVEAATVTKSTPTTTTTKTATVSVTKAITASQFLDSLGINTHFNHTDKSSAYSYVTTMESELQYVGIRYARDYLASSLPTLQKVHQDIGTKFDIIADANPLTEVPVLQANTALLEEVEGPNEINNWPITYNGTTGITAATSFQSDWYKKMKSTAGMSGFSFNNLTVSNTGYISQIGNLATTCDYANSHIYPQFGSNATPSGDISWSTSTFGALAVGKPQVVTEFGWWTQPMAYGVPSSLQAKFTLNFFFDAFNLGIHRSYLYELNDEYVDTNNTSIEYHFGLFQADGTPKPAATAMNVMTTLLADPKPLTTTSGLALTISKASTAPTINSLLMQRGDGVFILALWQDPLLWDYSKLQSVPAAAQQALIDFGVTASAVQVFDPLVGTTATASYTTAHGFTQMVPDHPVFVFIKI